MTNVLSTQAAPVKNEQTFLAELDCILPETFQAKIFPADDGKVAKAKVNTKETLDTEVLQKLIVLAGNYNLPIEVSRSGAGLRILFGRE